MGTAAVPGPHHPAGKAPRLRVRDVLLGIVFAAVAFNFWFVMVRQTRVHITSRLRSRSQGPAEAMAAVGAARAADTCHTEKNAEYFGETVVRWGSDFLMSSAAECCNACQTSPGCNVWVYCADSSGCGAERQHQECWLKTVAELDVVTPRASRGAHIPWTSGAVYTAEEYNAAVKAKESREKGESKRLAGLRRNDSLPLVFLDVEIAGRKAGRIEFALFTDVSPRAAENFRRLCTGEIGVVPEGREGAGKPYHLKGQPFYRIIDQFIDQSGAPVESTFGGQFKDDAGGIKLKHDRKGLLSMANMGPNTNTAHFSIMMNPAPHLDGHYTIFGQAVTGFDVIDAINALSKGKPENTATAADGALIVDSGQLRKGTIIPDLGLEEDGHQQQVAEQ